MTGTWDDDGVDDHGVRMVDDVALRIEAEEDAAAAAAAASNKGGSLAAAAGTDRGGQLFGRQRQVQHLREAHRKKMEELRRERADDDGDQLSSDDEHMVLERRRRTDVARLDRQPTGAAGSLLANSNAAAAGSNVTVSPSGRINKTVSFSPVAVSPIPHGGTRVGHQHQYQHQYQQKQHLPPKLATANRSRLLKQKPNGENASAATSSPSASEQLHSQHQHHHHLSFDDHQHHDSGNSSQSRRRPTSPGDLQQRTGASTPSSATSGEESLTILDIGSDRMPLRFFPDERTSSGWRGVVQPTVKPQRYSGSRSTSRPDTPPRDARRRAHGTGTSSRSSTSASSPKTAAGSPAIGLRKRGDHASGASPSSSSNSTSPLNKSSLAKASAAAAAASSSSPSSQPPTNDVHAAHSLPHYVLPLERRSSSPSGTHRGGIAGFEKRVSLKKSHVTVFNTFREPDPVPGYHKQHHANPTQAHIMKALPQPRGDVDVAFLKPVVASAAPGSINSSSIIITNSSSPNRTNQSHAAFGASMRSPQQQQQQQQHANNSSNSRRVNAFLLDGKPAELLSDVRLIVLDNIHGNMNRLVDRQVEHSPQRLPRPRHVGLSREQERAQRLWMKEEIRNRMLTAVGDYEDEDTVMRKEREAEEKAAAEAARKRKEEQRAAAVAAKRKMRMLQRQDVHLQQEHERTEAQADGESGQQQRGAETQIIVEDTSSDEDVDDAEHNFVSVADEKVIVGGDVIGGKPLLLPKVRGRWDAMRDALKERYFAKAPPPVEPIGHALRVIPLPELCSMYRQCVKEFKGALEMDRPIFRLFVKTMLGALPNNFTVTDADIEKYYLIFDMNDNGGISFVETLTTIVDFQTDKRETQFLHDVFNSMLVKCGNEKAVDEEDLSARVPWSILERSEAVFEHVLKALGRSARFPRVVEKTFCDCLAVSMTAARVEAESALCQESFAGLFWQQFRLLVCLDPELIVPLRTLRLQ